ncbi:unnamed protein product [Onchocerca flexuosa]|uniref:DUF19 domain-containing protein n=1 Tax=Onchocerca flexuosa TaxID=387005 RepID=A0A183HR19_9BILA|nr:unnamed protein product [Onchocerca flexuosa]
MEICNLYDKYDKCISDKVFAHSNGKRCAFNTPLNSLARIGLSPICSERSRTLLQENFECIEKIKHRTASCQSGLSGLGLAIHNMLQVNFTFFFLYIRNELMIYTFTYLLVCLFISELLQLFVDKSSIAIVT